MTTGSPYPFLEDTDWRALLARAAVYRAVHPYLAQFHDLSVHTASTGTVLNLLHVTAHQVATSVYTDEEVVSSIMARWIAKVQAAQLDPLSTEESDLCNRLWAAAPDLRPHDPFAELLSKITPHAAAVYKGAWREPTLSLSKFRSSPPERDLFFVTASYFNSHTVELEILIGSFSPAAYAVVPALLIHECVCHVPARQSRTVDNSSLFAEGFMDWIAQRCLENWMGLIDGGLAPAALLHGRALHQAMCAGYGDAASARRLGHVAAERLTEWFQTDLRLTRTEAAMTVMYLGWSLNVVDVDLAVKDHFVSQLLDRSPQKELCPLLREWKHGSAPAADLLHVVDPLQPPSTGTGLTTEPAG